MPVAEKRDYYEVLGLSRGAGPDEIKKAYRQAALKQGEKRDLADREAKRVAALKRQQELEAEKLRRQSIEPIDYRRREQYSLGIGLYGDQLRGTKQLTSPVPLR